MTRTFTICFSALAITTIAGAQPCAPTLLASIDVPGMAQAHDVFIDGHVAYVGAWELGLATFSISDPANPAFLSLTETNDAAFGVIVDDSVAYVADRLGRLVIMDVSDPAAPTTISTVSISGVAHSLAKSGDTLFVVAEPFAGVVPGGVTIIDVADPAAPAIRSYIPSAGGVPSGLDLVDDLLYLTDGFKGLLIYDVFEPGTPLLLSQINPYAGQSAARDVKVVGDYAFCAWHTAGFQVFNVADPAAPIHVASIDTPGDAWSIHVTAHIATMTDRVYIDDLSTLMLIDVADPTTPKSIGDVTIPDAATSHTINGALAYLTTANADPTGGRLDAIDLAPCLPCPADIDADADLTILDFVHLQLAFKAADPIADCNEDAAFTIADFVCYQQLFLAGCP
jgi:hypothetical protein